MRACMVMAAVGFAVSIANAQETMRLVAEFGQSLPGAAGVLDSVDDPAMLADGSVVFQAMTNENVSGIWVSETSGVISPLVVEGDELEFLVGIKGMIRWVGTAHVDGRNRLVCELGYEDIMARDREIVLRHDLDSGAWEIVLGSPDNLPLPDGVQGTGVINLWHNQAGTLMFQRGISSPAHVSSLDSALWRGDDLELVTLTREQVGGTRPMTATEFYEPKIRDNGSILTEVRSDDIVVLGRREWPDEGLFEFTSSGELIELGRVGDSVPGAAPEAFISAIDSQQNVAANSAGETAYAAIFRNDFGGPKEEGDVIVLHTPAGERLRVIGRGQKPTGSPPSGPELASLRVEAMTRTGGVVFHGLLDGPQTFEDEGLWIGFAGGRTVNLLLENQTIAGFDDWRVKDLNRVLPLETGDVLIGADIGPATMALRYPALHFKHVIGATRQLLVFDDQIDLGGGRLENIERVGVYKPVTTRPCLGGNRVDNDTGQVLLEVRSRDADLFLAVYQLPVSCKADCDGNGELDLFDFLCFQSLFASGLREADCDGDGRLDLFDFLCFQSAFAIGCP